MDLCCCKLAIYSCLFGLKRVKSWCQFLQRYLKLEELVLEICGLAFTKRVCKIEDSRQ